MTKIMIDNNGIVLILHSAKTLTIAKKNCFQSCFSCHVAPISGKKWKQGNKLKITARI